MMYFGFSLSYYKKPTSGVVCPHLSTNHPRGRGWVGLEVEVEVDGRQRSRSFRSILAFLNIPVLCDNILSTRSALFQFTSGAGFSGANAHKSRSLHFISVQSSVEFLRKTPEPFTNHFNPLFWQSKDANDPRSRI